MNNTNMNNNFFQKIISFINLAHKNRKYAKGTAEGFRAAIRKFEAIANNEERRSSDLFLSRIDPIFRDFADKYKDTMSLDSMNIYRRRMKRVISDFDKYGDDPSKMATWSPNTRVKSLKIKRNASNNMVSQKTGKQVAQKSTNQLFHPPESAKNNDETKISLSESSYAFISTPSTMTKSDFEKIKAYLNYLESITEGNSQEVSHSG